MVVVSFDKVEGLTVVGENLQHKFSSLKEAFAFASICDRNPYIRNIEIKRIDSPK